MEQPQSLHGHIHSVYDAVLGAQVLEHREKQYDLRVRMDVHVQEGDSDRVWSCLCFYSLLVLASTSLPCLL